MANPDPRRVEIGSLRWPVTIAKRIQAAAGASTITETLTDIITVRADVQPLGPMTFIAAQQTDRPLTHKIRIRWLDWLDLTHIIIRRTIRPDLTTREEIFRIRKIGEIDGRKRFCEILAEMEHRQ